MLKETVQDYCGKELDKLIAIGDSCTLIGRATTLRSCVSRYQEESNLIFSTKIINNELRVIVMGVGK